MKLRVLIPSPKPGNTFFEEVIGNSSCEFEYGNLESDISKYDLVLFHWPELIFKWADPNDKQLARLELKLLEWKKSAKIVYVIHNEKPHFGTTPRFEKLYQLILLHSDAMVHFGTHSLQSYKERYPFKTHEFIPHPLYENTFNIVDKYKARKALGLSQSKKIILVPGRVRTIEERALIISAYKGLNVKNTQLLVPYMFKKKMPLNIKGSYRLQRTKIIKNVIHCWYNRENINSYKFGYNLVENDRLGLMMSAADVVLIPRINALNSGILFLALTFKKIVVGPEIGNIEEFLDIFNMPKFNPKNQNSITKALNMGLVLENIYEYSENELNPFRSQNVAAKWDEFLNKLKRQ